LSMGYKIYPEATKFWQKQVSAGLATYIEEEGRYKALLQTSNL